MSKQERYKDDAVTALSMAMLILSGKNLSMESIVNASNQLKNASTYLDIIRGLKEAEMK